MLIPKHEMRVINFHGESTKPMPGLTAEDVKFPGVASEWTPHPTDSYSENQLREMTLLELEQRFGRSRETLRYRIETMKTSYRDAILRETASYTPHYRGMSKHYGVNYDNLMHVKRQNPDLSMDEIVARLQKRANDEQDKTAP